MTKALQREEQVAAAAHRLAVKFTEDIDLPARYRIHPAASRKTRKARKDSGIERRFRATVQGWTLLIETMISKIDQSQAWRFINSTPQFEEKPPLKLTENRDFCDFLDYLILRRDKERCEADELGFLALLLGAFQNKVEESIDRHEQGTPVRAGDAV
jgi:hypothetical protein